MTEMLLKNLADALQPLLGDDWERDDNNNTSGNLFAFTFSKGDKKTLTFERGGSAPRGATFVKGKFTNGDVTSINVVKSHCTYWLRVNDRSKAKDIKKLKEVAEKIAGIVDAK